MRPSPEGSVEITPEVDAFLRETRVAVISTIGADGAPRTAPIWFLWDGAAPILFTSRHTLKWRNIQRDPRVSLCVDDRNSPYEAVIIEGHVEEASERSLSEDVLAMSVAYYGREEGERFASRYLEARPDAALFRIVPKRVIHQPPEA